MTGLSNINRNVSCTIMELITRLTIKKRTGMFIKSTDIRMDLPYAIARNVI